jgi:hypothetical protein
LATKISVKADINNKKSSDVVPSLDFLVFTEEYVTWQDEIVDKNFQQSQLNWLLNPSVMMAEELPELMGR